MNGDSDGRAMAALREAFGPDAEFRDGQAEAVDAVVDESRRLLVVQRTGWGKSVVYFAATSALRARGHAPTIVISPLLSLMRDQRRSAARFGLHSEHVDSRADYAEIRSALEADAIDVIFTTPEQLAGRFVGELMGAMRGAPGLVVIDEAHCISDWGHDFRPEYGRVRRFLAGLERQPPLVATTATANERVIEDVVAQLGSDLVVSRGPLARQSLRVQSLVIPSRAARLAWLAQNLPQMDGSGIIYCLTVRDCERVSAWLAAQGIDAPFYHGGMAEEGRVALEDALLSNRVKALVATVALGMGFDKPDLGFVVHFQLPASIIAYYQQVGRAGRSLDAAHAILLSGGEDAAIHDYFIRSAFPRVEDVEAVLAALDGSSGLGLYALLARVNASKGKLEQILHMLELDGNVVREKGRYRRTDRAWEPDHERIGRVTATRRAEFEQMQALASHRGCLMRWIVAALDDLAPGDWGVCANCAGPAFDAGIDPTLERAAATFWRGGRVEIPARKQRPATPDAGAKKIPGELQCEAGRALCLWGDEGWGRRVAEDRRAAGGYGDDLADALVRIVTDWRPDPRPTWVTAIPSRGHPDRVAELASRVAARLGLPYRPTLARRADAAPQDEQQNSSARYLNAGRAYRLEGEVPAGPVFLLDAVVDSGWTLAVCGARLREAGSGPVHPLALARATRPNLTRGTGKTAIVLRPEIERLSP